MLARRGARASSLASPCSASRAPPRARRGSLLDLVDLARISSSGSTRGARRAARVRARRARARRRSGGAAADGRSGVGEERLAVVVQVPEILQRPSRRSRTSAARRARDGAPADLDVPTRGRSPRTRPTAQAAHVRTGTRCRAMPLEVDLDGREAVLAVEEARRREAVAGSQRLDEAVQPRAQARRSATRPRRAPGAPWPARAGRRRGRCARAPRPRRRARAGAGASRPRPRARRRVGQRGQLAR